MAKTKDREETVFTNKFEIEPNVNIDNRLLDVVAEVINNLCRDIQYSLYEDYGVKYIFRVQMRTEDVDTGTRKVS